MPLCWRFFRLSLQDELLPSRVVAGVQGITFWSHPPRLCNALIAREGHHENSRSVIILAGQLQFYSFVVEILSIVFILSQYITR